MPRMYGTPTWGDLQKLIIHRDGTVSWRTAWGQWFRKYAPEEVRVDELSPGDKARLEKFTWPKNACRECGYAKDHCVCR